jgi:DNA-binding response OmpR family regulator
MLKNARVLIVDDDPSVRLILERTLQHEGYELDQAANGMEALEKIHKSPYHLILLDIQMKPMDGIKVLSEVRKADTNVVVILLTAHSTIESAVEALHLGAFDYLFKPATTDVIRQRVREGLQRYEQASRRTNLLAQIESLRATLDEIEVDEKSSHSGDAPGRFTRMGNLVVDHHHRIVTLAGRLIDLTTTEFDLLTSLVEASPRPVAPRQLVSAALGYECEETAAREIIKWHIHRLRQKIETDPEKPVYIKTLRYKGYLWNS